MQYHLEYLKGPAAANKINTVAIAPIASSTSKGMGDSGSGSGLQINLVAAPISATCRVKKLNSVSYQS